MSFDGLFARLLIDIRIHIANYDEGIFYVLYRHDEEFAKYARSIAGINDFIRLAKKEEIDEYGEKTTIFGRLHSFNDEPARSDNVIQGWCYNGDIHRDGDKPAMVFLHMTAWAKYGKWHRDDDKPAQIFINGSMSWYFNGEMYRHKESSGRIIEGDELDYYGRKSTFMTNNCEKIDNI